MNFKAPSPPPIINPPPPGLASNDKKMNTTVYKTEQIFPGLRHDELS